MQPSMYKLWQQFNHVYFTFHRKPHILLVHTNMPWRRWFSLIILNTSVSKSLLTTLIVIIQQRCFNIKLSIFILVQPHMGGKWCEVWVWIYLSLSLLSPLHSVPHLSHTHVIIISTYSNSC